MDTASISRNVVVDVPVVSDANLALEKLLEWAESKDTEQWQKEIAEWDKKNPLEMRRDCGMTPQMVFEHVNRTFREAVYVTDVGQHQMWATQYLELDSWHQLITSGGLGTMGFGFPAAIGAKIGNRDKEVVCFTGDGGFQMNIQEMATAVVQEAPVIICLFNNYYLGMVRQMQQLFYGNVMRQPACAEGEPVRRTARDRMHPVRRTHRILSHWQRATAHTGSVWKKRRTSRRHLMRRVPTQMPRPSLNL